MQKTRLFAAVLLLIVAVFCPVAGAAVTTYGFSGGSGDGIAGQMFVDVEDLGASGVRFGFRNVVSGGLPASITDVFFKDGSLFWLSQIVYSDSSGSVAFGRGLNPGNLGDIAKLTAGFTADDVVDYGQNGVDPGQWLGIDFLLKGGQGYQDVIDEIASGTIQIGIYVDQGNGNGQRLSNMRSPVTTPAPGAVLLGSIGIGIVGWLKRRRSLR